VTAEQDFLVQGSGFIELWTKPLDLRDVLGRIDALTGSSDQLPAAAMTLCTR